MPYQLRNDQLIVDVAKVGESYTGTRFDWTGIVTGVTLIDGERNHTFCVPESYEPGQGTGGIGLCNDFGITQAIGYEDTPVGGCFPKLGVGLLTRIDDGPYQFFRSYPLTPFRIDVQVIDDRSIHFTVHSEECRGYAAQLEKRLSINGNRLSIEYVLTNTGQLQIETNEYNHNFIGINSQPVGEDYVLRFPYTIRAWSEEAGTMDGVVIGAQEVTWVKQPEQPFYFCLSGYEQGSFDWMWELVHKPSGVGVRDISRFAISSVAVWGEKHVVSPEMFIQISLAPG